MDTTKELISWWESKRWIFNIAVGITGGIAIYFGLSETFYRWSMLDNIAIIVWGIGANIFYSQGILLELFDSHYFKDKLKVRYVRWPLFLGGTLYSCYFTWMTVLSVVHSL